MKKLLSVLLVITMVFSMMSSVTAFASEDVVPAEEPISEDIATPADDPAPVEDTTPAKEPAPTVDPAPAEEPTPEETPAPADDLLPVSPLLPVIGLLPAEDSAPAESLIPEHELLVVEETEEAPVEEEPAAEEELILDGAAWAKAGGFVNGQSYIIAVENTDGTLSVLKNDGGKVVTALIDSAADATADMVWTISSGSKGKLISNNGTNLYYNNTMSTTASKGNWTYSDSGALYYDGQGKTYITFVDGSFTTEKDAANPATIVLYTDGADLAIPSKWNVASGFVNGQNYIIGVDNGDGTYTVLKNDGGAIIAAALADPDSADSSLIWTAATGSNGFLISNNGVNLYYKPSLGSTTENKGNWNYSGSGNLYYDGGGKTYITFADGIFGVEKDAATPAVLVLLTDGTDLGTGSEGGNSGDSGSGGDSAVIYTETNALDKHAYVGIVVDAIGMALSLDMGWHGETVTIAGEAPNRTMEATKGTGATVVLVESAPGVALTLEDPPGEINYLYVDETGALTTAKTGEAADYAGWNYSGTTLSYTTAGGTVYYVVDLIGKTASTDASIAQKIAIYGGSEAPSGGGGGGSEEEVDAEAPVIVDQPNALPYVIVDSGYDAPSLTVSAQLAEGVTANSLYFQWYVDGVAYGERTKYSVADLADGIAVDTAVFENLKDKPVGVYNIYCEVSCNIKDAETGEPVAHTTKSFSVSFIVSKGVLENSFMTFSDVHQSYDDIGTAINDIITVHGGFIPAMIICTGDWANGHYSGGDETSENYATTLNDYITRMVVQVGGIDMIFVSGNHDNGAAAADATIAADLGAAADYDGVGQIYDDSYNSPSVGTSAENKGLAVFGINYENLETTDGGCSYDAILPELEAFLSALEADYKGELVVISAHAGLHVVNGDWSGGQAYNVDGSDKMVALLNEYADTMDIMFFFGHDHSKGETEFFYKPGDSITSTVNYTAQTTSTQTINFSYGHAGYIGSGAAGATTRYSLVTWDGNSITRSMSVVNGNEISELTYALTRVAEPPAPPSGGEDHQPGDDGPKPSDKPTGDNIPDTGDDAPIVLWAVVLVLSMAALIAVLPRKKHN